MRRRSLHFGSLTAMSAIALVSLALIAADTPEDIRQLKLRDWAPKPMLVVPQHELKKPLFPAIDVHNHLGGGKQFLTAERVARYLEEMNEAGVRTVVNLDGGWGDRLKETLAALDEANPGRFLTFALINFDNIDDEAWSARETARLEESFRAGAKGLKFHKTLGLSYRYKDGKLMGVDDPKLAPIFELCGKHKKPVMIHTADPAAFFTPLDRFNERWHELNEHPNWLFYGERFPKREDLLAQFIRAVKRHKKTTFIGAHFGNNVEDLATVGQWLDRCPNLFVDIDARISELGRQPYTARKFFLKYQDRIMFGTDTTPRREAFRIYYRFLETEDEYFDCAASHHLQGFWRIYGIHLPREVLQKVYYQNAERVLAGTAIADHPSRPAAADKALKVRRTEDFTVSGDGSAKAWQPVPWEPLTRREAQGNDYKSQFKMLYSDRGLYVLMQGDDRKLTASFEEDFADLWTQDVFEFFLWPDGAEASGEQRQAVYFEYEISPLGRELPILVPNVGGKFKGWRPWHYEGDRRIVKATAARGGKKASGAEVAGWSAEVFVPYELLKGLANVPPKPGARWRANFYRMDYDDGRTTSWDWSRVGKSFHEFAKFGTLVFE
jgi:predicted TIM-barrel fold metal-dependent hydrolase